MENTTQKHWTTLLLIVVAIVYSCFFFIKPINLCTADLGRHIVNGELLLNGITDVLYRNFYSYTEPDHPFTNHHWLSGVLFYWMHQLAGFKGLSILYMLLVCSALGLVVMASDSDRHRVLPILVALTVVQMLSYRVEIRPEGFSYLLIALLFWMLQRIKKRPDRALFWSACIVVLQLLWVNLHIFFILGIGTIGVFLVDAWINQRQQMKAFGMLLLATIAVSTLNPHGVKGLLAPFTIFDHYGYMVAENQNILFMIERFNDMQLVHFALFSVLCASIIVVAVRKRLWKKHLVELLLVLTFGILSSFAVRGIPLFAMFFVPFVSGVFFSLLEDAHFRTRKQVLGALPFAGIAFCLLFILLPGTYASARKEYAAIGLIDGINQTGNFLRQQAIPGPIFNNYDVGGYLIYHLHDREKVFVDNRPEAYSVAFFDSIYKPMQQDESSWKHWSRTYKINLICFFRHDNTPWAQPFLIRRTQDPEWVPIFVDHACIVLVRNIPSNRKWIERYAIDRSVFRSVPGN